MGIIAAFVTLSETVAGLAAAVTEGPVQIAFTAFAVIFPVLVGAAFFAILWKRSFVLYHPKEFGADVDVRQYVEAMRHQAITNQEIVTLIQTSIQSALSSREAQVLISQAAESHGTGSPAALENVSATLTQRAVGKLQDALVTVDLRAFTRASKSPLVFPYNPDEEAFLVLSAIYFHIDDYVAPFTYGLQWALQDIASGELLLPKEINWSDNFALATSGATARQLGLDAGMRLRAIPLDTRHHR